MSDSSPKASTSGEGAAAPSAPVGTRQFLQLFTAVMLPMFMAAVDQTLLATATPVIAQELGGLRDTSWIAVGYLLAAAATTPMYGRFGDRYGRRNTLLFSLGIFTVGSVACAASQSLAMLVAARVLQGIGGGGLMTLCQALSGELVLPRERARFQGYFAAMFSLASVGGPVIGGLVVSHGSWRWLFLINVPLAALAVWRLLTLPALKPKPSNASHDFAGIFLFAGAIVVTLYWLSSGGHRFAWGSGTSLALGAASAVLFAALVVYERRQSHPFLPLELLRLPAISFCAATTLLFAACMFAMIFFLPVYLQIGYRTSAVASGLLILPMTLGMVTGSTASGRIVARTGRPRWVPVTGMGLASAALVALSLVSATPGAVATLGFVVGMGFGTVMPTMQVTVQTVAGRERLGAATSIVSLSRSLGAATGTALFGALVFALMPETDLAHLSEHVRGAEAETFVPAFHKAFLVAAAVAALSAFAASRVPDVRLKG